MHAHFKYSIRSYQIKDGEVPLFIHELSNLIVNRTNENAHKVANHLVESADVTVPKIILSLSDLPRGNCDIMMTKDGDDETNIYARFDDEKPYMIVVIANYSFEYTQDAQIMKRESKRWCAIL